MRKTILFDLDGVLIDSEKLYTKFWMQAAQETGNVLTWEDALNARSCDRCLMAAMLRRRNGGREVYDQVYRRRRELMSDYMAHHLMEMKPHVPETLRRLKEDGYGLNIVTSSTMEDKRILLQQLGIDSYFSQLVSAHEVPRGKPFPDVYLCALGRLGLQPEDCVAVEDSPNGVQSAYAAGIPVIMIPDLTQPDESLREKCTVCPNFASLPTFLQAIPSRCDGESRCF